MGIRVNQNLEFLLLIFGFLRGISLHKMLSLSWLELTPSFLVFLNRSGCPELEKSNFILRHSRFLAELVTTMCKQVNKANWYTLFFSDLSQERRVIDFNEVDFEIRIKQKIPSGVMIELGGTSLVPGIKIRHPSMKLENEIFLQTLFIVKILVWTKYARFNIQNTLLH